MSFIKVLDTENVRVVCAVKPTPEEAFELGEAYVRGYEAADPVANTGEVLGVESAAGGYRAVVFTTTSKPAYCN